MCAWRRHELAELKEQLRAVAAAAAALPAAAAGGGAAGGAGRRQGEAAATPTAPRRRCVSAVSLHSWWCEQAATQTDGAQDEAAAREAMAHWQQLFSEPSLNLL